LAFALADRRRAAGSNPARAEAPARPLPLVPWFIVGFLALMGLNLLGLIPPAAAEAGAALAGALTVVAMAGLGLSVDVRTVGRAGQRVSAAVTLSLLALGGLALLLVRLVVPA
ncbi:putative sulfate exporter family transporter, partial [Caenispirillum bisanense]|uniref:putative sulfate exporter family transporter n=1 Tax=Caenispirillum bisanense TaxID=414052 RepID=UPI0031D1A37D